MLFLFNYAYYVEILLSGLMVNNIICIRGFGLHELRFEFKPVTYSYFNKINTMSHFNIFILSAMTHDSSLRTIFQIMVQHKIIFIIRPNIIHICVLLK